MSYLLTFLAGMVFSVAVIVLIVGYPMDAMKYMSCALGALFWAWHLRFQTRCSPAMYQSGLIEGMG